MSQKRIRRFSELPKISSDKITMREILGEEVIIDKFSILDSRINDGEKYVRIELFYEGERKTLNTGSKVLLSQLTSYQDFLPFSTIINKVNDKFYSFS